MARWRSIPFEAEGHGLAPLLYVYLQAAGIQLPPAVKRALQGLYLRHRQANQIRTQMLSEILTAFNAANIRALILKGRRWLTYFIHSPVCGQCAIWTSYPHLF